MSSPDFSSESTEPIGTQSIENRKKSESILEEWVFKLFNLINAKFSVVFVSPDDENKDEENKEDVPPISFFAVYRYADKIDYTLLFLGVLLCLLQVCKSCRQNGLAIY